MNHDHHDDESHGNITTGTTNAVQTATCERERNSETLKGSDCSPITSISVSHQCTSSNTNSIKITGKTSLPGFSCWRFRVSNLNQ
eukprot:1248803-Rhodomonas_salina.1